MQPRGNFLISVRQNFQQILRQVNVRALRSATEHVEGHGQAVEADAAGSADTVDLEFREFLRYVRLLRVIQCHACSCAKTRHT